MKNITIIIALGLLWVNHVSGQVLNGSLSGSFESNNIYYFDDISTNALQPDNPVGSNNYLKLDYRRGPIAAGIQYEAYLAPLAGYNPLLEGNDLVFKYFQYANHHLDLTVGNFYEQFGSGLVFRSYEERAIGLNTAMDGVRLKFQPFPFFHIRGIWGKQRKYLDNGQGTVRGLDAEVDLIRLLNPADSNTVFLAGGSWINRYQPYTGPVENYPPAVNARSVRLQFDRGFFSLYSEYVNKDREPTLSNENSNETGNGLLVSPSFVGNNIGVNFNLRCLKNMEFRSEREAVNQTLLLNYLPALTRQHKYALANLYPFGALARGEIGGQMDVFYRIKRNSFAGGKYGMNLSANASWYNNLATGEDGNQQFLTAGDRKLFHDVNIEVEKRLSAKLKTILSYINLHYNEGAILADGNEFIRSQVAVVDVHYRFSVRSSLRAEIQHLWSKHADRNWLYGLVEYSLAPGFSFYASDMVNYGSTGLHYASAGFSFSRHTTRVSFTAGRNRAGLVCVGGICNMVPAYTGIGVSVVMSF